MESEKILVLDFGGQYNQLIARRVRDLSIFAEILPYTTPIETLKANRYAGIILTGGIAYSEMFTGMVRKYVEKLSEVTIVPGSFEMEALAKGALRVLKGEEGVNDFNA